MFKKKKIEPGVFLSDIRPSFSSSVKHNFIIFTIFYNYNYNEIKAGLKLCKYFIKKHLHRFKQRPTVAKSCFFEIWGAIPVLGPTVRGRQHCNAPKGSNVVENGGNTPSLQNPGNQA